MDRKSSIEAFTAAAREYVGCRWRHRGRSRFGVDCIGVVVMSLGSAGVSMRDRLDYGREPWNDGLDREMREHFGAPVELSDMRAGDVVTMVGDGQAGPGHVGVVAELAGRLTLIHSYNTLSNSRVVEHGFDDTWLARINAVYRPFP